MRLRVLVLRISIGSKCFNYSIPGRVLIDIAGTKTSASLRMHPAAPQVRAQQLQALHCLNLSTYEWDNRLKYAELLSFETSSGFMLNLSVLIHRRAPQDVFYKATQEFPSRKMSLHSSCPILSSICCEDRRVEPARIAVLLHPITGRVVVTPKTAKSIPMSSKLLPNIPLPPRVAGERTSKSCTSRIETFTTKY